MIIGYARVSTDGQTLDAQHTTFESGWRSEGLLLTNSRGPKTNRSAAKQRQSRPLGTGDVLLVTRLDRLAKINPRPVERARNNLRQRSGLQIASGYLGRYYNGARTANAHCARWPS